jgi:hypothetical protein
MIHRPPGVGAFQFVVLSTLRAAQLLRGCRPRVEGLHKAVIIAQCEVAEGKVTQLVDAPPVAGEPAEKSEAPLEPAEVIV